MTKRVAFHWSGGKDSALALSLLQARKDVLVDRLVTTVHADRDQSTVHGLPVALLEAQARSIGIKLQTITLPGPGLDGYVEAINAAAVQMLHEGIEAFAFGDLPESEVLTYKEAQFGPLGIEVIEPLWELSSSESIELFLASGLRAVTVVVNAGVLDPTFLGVELDRAFINRLPAGTDLSGEFGEYHTFVYAGPLFSEPIGFDLSPVRRLEREINTTDGIRRYAYWLTTPLPRSAVKRQTALRPAAE